MSIQMTSMVMQHYPGDGKLYLLALCLADSANAHGESIFPSVRRLAHYSRQSPRNVQRQLRMLEQSGWLICTERSVGGRACPSRYRIAPEWIADPAGWARNKGLNYVPCDEENHDTSVRVSSEKPRQNVVVSDPETTTNRARNHDTAVSPEQKQQEPKPSPLTSPQATATPPVGCAAPSDDPEARADCELAEWMFGLVLALHPGHSPPKWSRWRREIRLMRQRDGRTRREIAGLFRWANGHTFWAANIRSPGKLREQWDTLVLQRKRESGQLARQSSEGDDRGCIRCHDGTPGRRAVPGVGWLCNRHIDEHEGLVHA